MTLPHFNVKSFLFFFFFNITHSFSLPLLMIKRPFATHSFLHFYCCPLAMYVWKFFVVDFVYIYIKKNINALVLVPQSLCETYVTVNCHLIKKLARKSVRVLFLSRFARHFKRSLKSTHIENCSMHCFRCATIVANIENSANCYLMFVYLVESH